MFEGITQRYHQEFPPREPFQEDPHCEVRVQDSWSNLPLLYGTPDDFHFARENCQKRRIPSPCMPGMLEHHFFHYTWQVPLS